MNNSARTAKICDISIFLFGKPDWEMDLEGAGVDEETVRELESLGDELKERLHFVSGMTKKLIENGWEGQGGLYDISFYKETTVEQAKKELQALGMDPRDVEIHEEEWEAEEMER
jgi:hypothetical protein